MQQTLDAVNSVLLLESITRHTNFSTDHQGKGVIYHFKTLSRTRGEPQDMGRNCFSFVPKYIGGGPRGKQLSNNSFRRTQHNNIPLNDATDYGSDEDGLSDSDRLFTGDVIIVKKKKKEEAKQCKD